MQTRAVCVGMRTDMCEDRRAAICEDIRLKLIGRHVCNLVFERAHEHAYRRVCRHVSRPIYLGPFCKLYHLSLLYSYDLYAYGLYSYGPPILAHFAKLIILVCSPLDEACTKSFGMPSSHFTRIVWYTPVHRRAYSQ